MIRGFRLFLILLAVAHWSAPSPAHSALPDLTLERVAEADWIVRIGKSYWLFYAGGWDQAAVIPGVGTTASWTLVGRSKCKAHRVGSDIHLTCVGVGRFRPAPPEAFQMDASMNEATLSYRLGKYRHSVRWSPSEPYHPETYLAPEEDALEAGAMLTRRASVTGRLFGRPLPQRGSGVGLMIQGLAVSIEEAAHGSFSLGANRQIRIERNHVLSLEDRGDPRVMQHTSVKANTEHVQLVCW